MNTTSLNARERKAQRLLAHYATCERLARYLGQSAYCPDCGFRSNNTTCPRCVAPMAGGPDGKKISVSLFKIERDARNAATAQCNGEAYRGQPYRSTNDHGAISEWDTFLVAVETRIEQALGTLPPGFFVNSDPRGYALKIDNENAEGAALIEAVGLARDMGGYGILSPEINGDW